jgi:SH3-like domain-containing protein
MDDAHIVDPEIEALASVLDAEELFEAADRLEELVAQIRARACALCGNCQGSFCQRLIQGRRSWVN